MSHKSVGVVQRIDDDGDIWVDFSNHSGWMGRLREMELAAIQWDERRKGPDITLSAAKTVATHGDGGDTGQSVRSKQAIMPGTGTRCFELIYNRPGRSVGASLGACYYVGVVEDDGKGTGKVNFNSRFWGLEDDGTMFKGDGTDGSSPNSSHNSNGRAFGHGERIGFALDTDSGRIQFFRNGKFTEPDIFEETVDNSKKIGDRGIVFKQRDMEGDEVYVSLEQVANVLPRMAAPVVA